MAGTAGGIADGEVKEGFRAEGIGAGCGGDGIPSTTEGLGHGVDGKGGLFHEPGVNVGALDGIGGDAGCDGGPGGSCQFPGIGEALADDGFQRGLDEFHDQGVRGVIRAGGFPGVSRGGTRIGDAHKPEGACGEVDGGNEFEQGFIDGAEFLGAHVPVVDGAAFSCFLVVEPAQLAHGGEEVAIGEGGGIEVRALGFREEAAEGGQGEFFLTACEGTEDDAEAEPEVAVGIVGGLAEGAPTQAAKAVAGGVGLAGGGRAVRGMQ